MIWSNDSYYYGGVQQFINKTADLGFENNIMMTSYTDVLGKYEYPDGEGHYIITKN